MLKMFDFECVTCGEPFEDLTGPEELSPCKSCGSADTRKTMPRAFGRPFDLIKATTKTSGPYKAGTIHKYHRPREKASVGWTGELA